MKINNILKFLNNQLLFFSYKLWKKDKDDFYYQLKDSLKPDYLDSQISIFSGMFLPIMILFLGLFFGISINALNSPWWWRGFIIYLIYFIIINIKHHDKYLDEKYLELSQIKGQINYDRGMDTSIINKVIFIGKQEGFDLKKGNEIIKLSAIPQIPNEIIIAIRIIGEITAIWVANKLLDSFWIKIKSLINKSKEQIGIIPNIEIEGDRNIIINFNFHNPLNLAEALEKLPSYINNNAKIEGWQWYNEDKKEWGDINKMMEWKRKRSEKKLKQNKQ